MADGVIWSTEDCFRSLVSMDSGVWEHICTRHKDLKAHSLVLKSIVEDPQFVLQDPEFENTKIFCQYQALGESKALYTNVFVGYQVTGIGDVKTAFRSTDIQSGKIIVVRKLR